MRGFSIRLRILGMCDILVEQSIVNYLLYLAVLSAAPPRTFWIWLDIYLALAIADLGPSHVTVRDKLYMSVDYLEISGYCS